MAPMPPSPRGYCWGHCRCPPIPHPRGPADFLPKEEVRQHKTDQPHGGRGWGQDQDPWFQAHSLSLSCQRPFSRYKKSQKKSAPGDLVFR